MARHGTSIRRGHVEIHRDQAIVERFNRTLAERLCGYQYAREFIQDGRSKEWARRLPHVVAALNRENHYKIPTTKSATPTDFFREKY